MRKMYFGSSLFSSYPHSKKKLTRWTVKSMVTEDHTSKMSLKRNKWNQTMKFIQFYDARSTEI